MTKTISVSDETYEKIKGQIEEEKIKEKIEKKLEIKNRFTGDVIYSSSKTTYKDVVEEAVENEANLRETDLYGANLSGANLSGAELDSAKFYGKGGTCKIKKNQVNNFLTALGIIVE